jgi:hypothetical protein
MPGRPKSGRAFFRKWIIPIFVKQILGRVDIRLYELRGWGFPSWQDFDSRLKKGVQP